MHITELLVTAYNGDEPMFAINLGPDTATVALLGPGGAVDSARNQDSQAFAAIFKLIEDLAMVPVR